MKVLSFAQLLGITLGDGRCIISVWTLTGIEVLPEQQNQSRLFPDKGQPQVTVAISRLN